MTTQAQPAKASGEFSIGGKLPVTRLGYGTMQLTGPGVWGDPKDPDEAVRVLRRAVELGVNFIDTADSYGPVVAERLIKKAAPLQGRTRHRHQGGPDAAGSGHLDPGPKVRLEDQVGELKKLQDEGKIRHIGLSEVTVAQLQDAQRIATIATVQNLYNLA